MNLPPVAVGDRVETLPHVGVAEGLVRQVVHLPVKTDSTRPGPRRYVLGLMLPKLGGGVEEVRFSAKRSDFVVLRPVAPAAAAEEEERRANRNRKGPR